MANREPDIERVAARLACLYVKEATGKTQKWEKMEPGDRSRWRLLARAAIAELEAPHLPATMTYKWARTAQVARRH